MLPEIERRFAAIEKRLIQLETRAGIKVVSDVQPPVSPAEHKLSSQPSQQSLVDHTAQSSRLTVTNILGWGGATALVLAAAYLIRLAIVDGWLTPTRQVAFAVISGLALIVSGIHLRKTDREYASLLPAGGIVILFLSIYGAHLYYNLIPAAVASVAVMAVCIGSLALCRVFNSQLYAFFAVIGSYSAPFLLGDTASSITDLVIYYSCWSVIFSVYAIWVTNRAVYLLALYMALVGFDVLWRNIGSDAWIAVVVFQFLQLLIFTVCAVVYAIKHNNPMTKDIAIAHAPALFIFYSLEYAVFDRNLPDLAPWIALISAGTLLIAYQVARKYLKSSLAGSKWLLASYCALVLLHAGYLESVPDGWEPWTALLLVAMAGVYLFLRLDPGLLKGPIGWVIGGIFALNYLRLVSGFETDNVPADDILLVLYALQLYAGYYFIRKEKDLSGFGPLLIYGGHVAAMTAALYILDGRFAVSLTWGVLALGCLLLALRIKNKALGQSSLLIFGMSAVKVFIFDIADTTSIIRVACLAALGVSLYLGGWLYKKIEAMEPPNEVT